MKNNAYLINTARGSLVNEEHLIEALNKQWIAGAALDVFEKEPSLPNNPLLKMENVLLLPHLGSATLKTRTKMAEVAAAPGSAGGEPCQGGPSSKEARSSARISPTVDPESRAAPRSRLSRKVRAPASCSPS